MAQLEVGIVEGWTGGMQFRLLADGTPQDLTGYTVAGQLYDRAGTLISTTDDVTIMTATAGVVKLRPDTDDFRVTSSPYNLRFKATFGGDDVFFPSEEPICITVRR